MGEAAARPSSAIILAAGKIDSDLANVLNCFSPLMLPFGGRPNVSWLLTELERLNVTRVYLVVNELDDRAQRFVTAHFRERIECHFVQVKFNAGTGPGDSLAECLRRHADAIRGGPLLIVNGDIYFEMGHSGPARGAVTIWTTPLIESDKYTFVATDADDRVVQITAKPEAARDTGGEDLTKLRRGHAHVYTEAGVYGVRDPGPLIAQLDEGGARRYRSVTGLLIKAHGDDMYAAPLAEWSDVSHLDSLLGTSDKSIRPRAFNRVTVDEWGVLHKTSTNAGKIALEINYYQNLPRELRIHFPRLVAADPAGSTYALEYYPYKTLSQYLVFQGLSLPIWRRALRKVISIAASFRTYARPNEPAALLEFYWSKTVSRYESAAATPALRELLSADEVVLNGRRLPGFAARRDRIFADLETLCRIERLTLVHGDLCFSNILFDPGSTLIRLIDPRGEFVDHSVYGDYRYDLAKLLHSVHGRYDFILHGLYALENQGENAYTLNLIEDEQTLRLQHELFALVREVAGPELRNVVLLEALLFISMIPLHTEDVNRQRAFYLTGLKILSEIYDENMY